MKSTFGCENGERGEGARLYMLLQSDDAGGSFSIISKAISTAINIETSSSLPSCILLNHPKAHFNAM